MHKITPIYSGGYGRSYENDRGSYSKFRCQLSEEIITAPGAQYAPGV